MTTFVASFFRESISNLLTSDEISSCIFVGLDTYDPSLVVNKPASFFTAASKVNIKKAPDNNKDGKAVTLHRIAISFPEVTCELLSIHRRNFRNLTPLKVLEQISENYPSIARHQACFAIVPDIHSMDDPGYDFRYPLAAIMLPMMLKYDNLELNKLYMKKGFDKCILSTEKRVELAVKYGIVTRTSDGRRIRLTPQWIRAGVKAKAFLDQKYMRNWISKDITWLCSMEYMQMVFADPLCFRKDPFCLFKYFGQKY